MYGPIYQAAASQEMRITALGLAGSQENVIDSFKTSEKPTGKHLPLTVMNKQRKAKSQMRSNLRWAGHPSVRMNVEETSESNQT